MTASSDWVAISAVLGVFFALFGATLFSFGMYFSHEGNLQASTALWTAGMILGGIGVALNIPAQAKGYNGKGGE